MEWKTAFAAYWRGYADFRGTANRGTYWRSFLIVLVIGFLLSMLAGVNETLGTLLASLWLLGTVVPSLAILTRRLRDAGFTMLWYLVLLAGPVGLGILLVLAAQDKKAEKQPKPTSSGTDKQSQLPTPTTDGFSTKEAKKVEKEKAKAAAQAADAARRKEEVEQYGRQLASETIGLKSVKIYEKGYVKVGMMGSFEKLKSIEATANVQKKTGAGRAVTAVLTAGTNLMTTPNKRGDIFLTIVTASNVHTVHTDVITEWDLKALYKLEQIGKSVLAATQATEPAPTTANGARSAPDLSGGLEKLVALRESGGLTEEEFAAAKAKLLAQ